MSMVWELRCYMVVILKDNNFALSPRTAAFSQNFPCLHFSEDALFVFPVIAYLFARGRDNHVQVICKYCHVYR
jgi:hypothetical protein